MRVLSIESSGRTGSIALVDASSAIPQVVVERQTADAERTAQSLIPAIKTALGEAAWKSNTVGLVCVTSGPGSFTGLRIGVATAKTFAYAVGAKLAGVNTLAAMAAGVDLPYQRLWTILDAQREELFAAYFEGDKSRNARAAQRTEILNAPQLMERLYEGDVIAGPPLVKLRNELPAGVTVLDERLWSPRATAVAILGVELLRAGEDISPMELVPHYYRKSAAEEKADRARKAPSPPH